MTIKLKKYTAIFITTIFLFTQNAFVPLALAVDYPDMPDSPDTATIEIDEPDAPEAADKPDLPDNAPEEYFDQEPDEDEDEPADAESSHEAGEDDDSEILDYTQEADSSDNNYDESNTGQQQDDGNSGDTTIETGDAQGSGVISNIGNTNIATDDPEEGGEVSGISIINDGNGTESENTGVVVLEDNSVVIQDNNANLNNLLEVDSNSGENSASKNTGGDTIIDTGDANASGTIINSVNTNIAGVTMISEFNVVDDQVGDLVLDFEENCISGCGTGINLQNTNNGSQSENNVELEIYESDLTFQNNNASVENELILSANTGDNTANKNTGGDTSIETGDANIQASVLNFLNNNIAGDVIYGVVNIFGDLVGDIIIPDKYASSYASTPISIENSGNGTESENNGEVLLVDNESFSQVNDANIINNLLIDANTGDNDVSRNTGGDNEVETGDVAVDVSILNIANNNIIGGDWWIVLVNEAGNWIGRIFAPDGSYVGEYYAMQGGQATEGEDGSINVTNSGNGTDSENNASVKQSSVSETVQTNNADITNNINLSANTGNNSASKNTGGDSSVETGDVNIQLNLVNFVNNNFAGGRVFLTIVNVFGNWFGDFVTPNSANAEDNSEEQYNNDKPAIGGVPDSSNNSSNNNDSNNNSSDDNNNDDNNNNSNNNDDSNNQSVLAVSTNNVNYYNSSTEGKLASGVTDESDTLALADTSVPVAEADSKTRVNLAWGLLLIPAYFVLRIVRRRLTGA